MTKKNCSTKPAFSLMEMMVVLLIIAIIAAVSAPMVSKKVNRGSSGDNGAMVFINQNGDAAFNPKGDKISALFGTIKKGDSNARIVVDSTDNRPAIAFMTGRNKNGIFDIKNDNSIVIGNGAAEAGQIRIGSNNDIGGGRVQEVIVPQLRIMGTYDGKDDVVMIINGTDMTMYPEGTRYNNEGQLVNASNTSEDGVNLTALRTNDFTVQRRVFSNFVVGGNIIIRNFNPMLQETTYSIFRPIAAHTPGNYFGSQPTWVDNNTILYQNMPEDWVEEWEKLSKEEKKAKMEAEDYESSVPEFKSKKDEKMNTNGYWWFDGDEKGHYRGYKYKTWWENYGAKYGYTWDGENWVSSSDRRLKNVGEKFTDGLAALKKLDLYHYVYKEDKDKVEHVGVMAQDLQKVFPNAVITGPDGYLRIRLEDMFYAVINAVKELDTRISEVVNQVKADSDELIELKAIDAAQKQTLDELNAENQELRAERQKLEKRLAKLEKKAAKKEKKAAK